jgi:catechol 2,3-dioxygenase-like lactoylglutathione lyase family enzyme
MDVAQIRLIVSDFKAVFRFYRDTIGLKPQFDNENGPYVAFKPDFGSALALHDRAELAKTVPGLKSGSGDNALIALRVDDLDAYLAGLPVPTTEPVILDDRVKVAYLRDPEGNLLELQQWLTTRSGAPIPPASTPN